MTKGKQKLIDKAKKYDFTDKEMELVYGDNPIYVTEEIVYGIYCLINETPEDEIISRVSIVLDTYNTYLNQDVKYTNLENKYVLRDLFGYIKRPLNILEELCKETICPEVIEYITNTNNFYYLHVLSFTDNVEIARSLTENFKKDVSFFKVFRCNKESQNTIMSDCKKNKNNSFITYLFTQDKNIHSNFLEESVEIYNHSNKNKSLKEVVLPYIKAYEYNSLEIDKKKLYTEMIKSNKHYGFIKQHFPKYRSGTFYSEKLFNEEIYKIPEDISATTINLSLGSSKVDISDSKGVFNIEFYNYSNTCITKCYDVNEGKPIKSINPTGKKSSLRLVLFSDGGIYQKSNNRLIPLQMKNLKYIAKNNKYAREFLNYICKDYDLGKDFLEDCDESCLIPISYQDITMYHNKQELFLNKYVKAKDLNINFNKKNMNLSYMLIKSMAYVTPESVNILQNINDEKLAEDLLGSPKGKIIAFLSGYYESKYDIDESIPYDYIRMCMNNKTKINLRAGKKSLIKAHDDMSLEEEMRILKEQNIKVKVPKDSKFNHLRTLLPDEYDWITTTKRLSQESLWQKHCVLNYWEDINRDHCAIYSYEDKDGLYGAAGLRYTMEFVKDRNGYRLVQCQRRRNKGDTSALSAHLRELIREKQYIE